MAKKLRISTDGGSTWLDLPGSEASLNLNGEQIDDTVLGQTFQSNEAGLINWGASANGIFKGFAGYVAELMQQGSSTATTGESMTQESGQIYAIDDSTREIWDRSQTVTVYDNAVDATANVAEIDYLFGRVTFDTGYSVTGPVTVDVNYYPLTTIARPNSYTLTMSADPKDESDFAAVQANSGYRVFSPGLRTVSLELGGIFDDNEDAKAVLVARSEIIVQIDPAGDGSSIARGFFKYGTVGQSGAVGAVEDETLNLYLVVPNETTNPQVETPFNWRHTNTTLSPAIQALLTSWLSELNTYDFQYLPQGTPGQSPLDGAQGNFMVSDVSLSGGLDAMNVFQAELQATGGLTEV